MPLSDAEVSADPSTGSRWVDSRKGDCDEGLRRKEGNRRYAVIHDGLDPVTGHERRIWHPASVDRADAEKLQQLVISRALSGLRIE